MSYTNINRTELVELARELGLGNVARLTNREELAALLDGDIDSTDPCPLEEHREAMERHIQRNFRRLRTQLPGCTGKCTSFGCPEGIVLRCWLAFKDDVI